MVCVTVVSVLYLAISLFVGDGIDMGAREEKPLLARVFVMYAVAATVHLISNFERSRWRAAVERERALQRERLELSEAIHDTVAQTAYMVGLGIDAAKQVAGDSNEELTARLDAATRLSMTAVWQLRHPIDMGRIFDGRDLGWALDSHVATYRAITSVSAELTQNGAGAAPFDRGQESPVHHSAQRPRQRLSPCRGEPGAGRARLRAGRAQAVGVGRRGGTSRRLQGARPRLRKHAGVRRAPGRTAYRRAQGTGRGGERDLSDAIGSRWKGEIGCQQSLVE